MTMLPPEGAFHRAPRPLVAWVTVILAVVLTLFVCAVLSAVAVGFWLTAARGTGVPDMTGGLGNMGALIAAITGAGGIGAAIFNHRHIERRDQIARGGGPAAPFDPSPPQGPRPGDSP